ncbi:MAG: hypothetical protein Q4F70_00620 [Clostridia bacterium]|nr:hypothetical protein [Clostridia bacterium]
MYEILLDVNGWQGLFDFQTGEALPFENKPYLELAKEVSKRHPYPGDLNPDVFKWTTDFALDVAREYDPQLMLISYANGMITRVNSKIGAEETRDLAAKILSEAFRFADETDYEPIIVSTGNMEKIDKVFNADDLEGYFNVSADSHIGGVFGATEKDYETVQNMVGIKSVMTRNEFVKKFGLFDDYALERTPDIVLFADDDYALTNTGNRGTTLEEICEKKKTLKAYSKLLGLPNDIFEFRAFIDSQLKNGKKIAVIVVEGIDDDCMPAGSIDVNREEDGIYYSEGVLFYYALLNAKRFNSVGMPYIFHNPFIKKKPGARYSYSYIKTDEFQNPIGFNRDFKTASVGTRSGIFHSACMCDYSFECHCRGLAESGVLTFVNSEKLRSTL